MLVRKDYWMNMQIFILWHRIKGNSQSFFQRAQNKVERKPYESFQG